MARPQAYDFNVLPLKTFLREAIRQGGKFIFVASLHKSSCIARESGRSSIPESSLC